MHPAMQVVFSVVVAGELVRLPIQGKPPGLDPVAAPADHCPEKIGMSFIARSAVKTQRHVGKRPVPIRHPDRDDRTSKIGNFHLTPRAVSEGVKHRFSTFAGGEKFPFCDNCHLTHPPLSHGNAEKIVWTFFKPAAISLLTATPLPVAALAAFTHNF